MKNKFITACIVLLFTAACTKNENTINDLNSSEKSEGMEIVKLSGGIDGLSVLIFDKNTDNNFYYHKRIATGWSDDGKLSTNLALGIYKFLFFKSTGVNTVMEPESLSSTINFNDIKFTVADDAAAGIGYSLPADEIWLPQSVSHSDREYIIENPTTVYDTLTRAVGKIEFNLMRGTSGTGRDTLAFENNENIMQNIEDISLDISGIAKTVSLWGGETDTKTKVTYSVADSITPDGFAVFDGLYVIPKGAESEATVNFTITPVNNNIFPELTKEIKGKVKRNQKLIITLWLTSTYKFIDVEVDIEDIEDSIDGDSGIWN